MDLLNAINQYKLHITGIIHVGAHHCEELGIYNKMGIPIDKIIWFEADDQLVTLCKKSNPNLRIYSCVAAEVDNRSCTFGVSSNTGASSSILPLGIHAHDYPEIKYVEQRTLQTTRLDTFFSIYGINEKFNFLTIDVQGAELLVLKGMGRLLEMIDYLYLEVNNVEMYKGCALIHELDDFLIKNGPFERVATAWSTKHWGDALYVRIN
jgi:FkbM family methyltransferase